MPDYFMNLSLSRAALRALFIIACLGLCSFEPAQAQRRPAASRYVCPMHAEVTSSKPGSCPKCKMKLVAQKRDGAEASTQTVSPQSPSAAATAARVRELEQLAPSYEYTCLMHPEIHQAQEGTCPKCGMPLSTVRPSVRGAYRLDVLAAPRAPKAGEKVRLKFVVSHPKTGARVRDYVLNHEKLFHLFIVSADMNEYQHIHPQLEPDGSFKVETTLPRAGLYKLHSDFFPTGGTLQVLHSELTTAGYHASSRTTTTPVRAALAADTSFTKIVDGIKVGLDWGGGELVPGAFVRLKYTLADAQTDAPVKDLEPYLGAWGHTLILNADQSDYLHSHPTETLPQDIDHPWLLRGGPEVEFGAMFPEAGLYRIWTQFQRGGRVVTVSFTIQVRPVAAS
jgi:hypothetical protein